MRAPHWPANLQGPANKQQFTSWRVKASATHGACMPFGEPLWLCQATSRSPAHAAWHSKSTVVHVTKATAPSSQRARVPNLLGKRINLHRNMHPFVGLPPQYWRGGRGNPQPHKNHSMKRAGGAGSQRRAEGNNLPLP